MWKTRMAASACPFKIIKMNKEKGQRKFWKKKVRNVFARQHEKYAMPTFAVHDCFIFVYADT